MTNVKELAARAIMMVLCAVVGLTALTSCNEGGKNEVASQGSSYSTISFEPNGEKDGGDVIFTISDGVESKSARIAVSSAVKADNDYEISPAQKAVAFTAAGDMTVDGTTASRKYNGSDAHQVSTSAHQDRLAVEVAGQTATVEFTGVTMTDVKVADNTSLQPLDGQRERMSTPVNATWTLKATFDGKTKNFELKPATAAIRWISQDAPEIVDSLIDWTDGEEIRSFYKVLSASEQAKIQIVYILSDGSRTDGPAYSIEVPRQLWGSEEKMYVSAFEQSIGTSFSGQSVVEPEAKSSEYSNENFTVSYETTKKTWEHTQLDVDGNKAKTALFGKLPHIVFNHGALSHDFGKLPLDVANTSVEVVEKSPVVEDGKSYEVKQIKNTISTSYGVDSTGIQNQQVISTVDLLKLNVAVKRDSTSAVMAQDWLSNQVNYTWSMTRWFSNGTQTHFDVKQPIARTIETNYWEATEFVKALTAGAARVKSQSESAKTINGVAEDGTKYTINYTDVETIYEWNNTLHSGKVVVSTATTHNPKNVRLTIDDRTFTQKGVTMKYNRGEAVLGDAEYNDGKTQVYPYSCVLTESVEGYAQSALAKAATGKLTVNAAKVVDFKIISKNDYFIGYKRFIDLRIKYIYSDGTDKQLDKHFELAGNGSSVKCVSTEEVVSERLLSVVAPTLVSAQAGKQNNFSYNLSQFSHNRGTERGSGSLEYEYSYSYPTEVKYVEEIDGVKIEVSFENPMTDVNFETSDFTKDSEEAVEGGTKETWTRPMNMILTLGAGNNNTIANQGIIYKFEAAQENPDAPVAVIGRGIVSPKQGLTDNMYYVGYLLKLNNGKVRPLIVDKNGQNVELGEEFDANAEWNGAAYINGTLYPVLGSNKGGMLKYTHKKGVSYAISAVNAGDGFNWNHATVENVTDHYKPVIKKQGGKTILTLEKVYNWSMSF